MSRNQAGAYECFPLLFAAARLVALVGVTVTHDMSGCSASAID